MNFREEFKKLLNEYEETTNTIKNDTHNENSLENEYNLIEAYNKLIRIARPIWGENDNDLKIYLKNTLSDIYYRTQNILQTLNSKTEKPTNLIEEIRNIEKPTPTEDTILQQKKLKYDENELQDLLDTFYDWNKKIIRKNASQEDDIVEERKNGIIDSYNKIIDFFTPVFTIDDYDTKVKAKDTLLELRRTIVEDLEILNANIEVPEDLTKKIDVNNSNSNNEDNNSDNNKPTNDNKKNNNTSDNKKNENKNSEPSNDNKKPSTSDLNKGKNSEPSNEDKKPSTNDLNKNTDDTKKTENNNKLLTDDKKPIINDNTKIEPTNTKTEDNKNTTNMGDNYYTMCMRQLNTMYSGDPLGLPPFIASIKLLQKMDTTNSNSDLLVSVIMTKLQGAALDSITQTDPTVEQIIESLKKNIKSDSSEIVQGKIMALTADKTNLTDFASKAEGLAEQFKRALILENIPNETATKMTTKAIAQLCRANTRSTVVNTLMAGDNFETAKDVIAKFIVETRTESNKHNSNNGNNVLAYRQTNRSYRNNFNRNGYNNNRYANQNRNYYRSGEQNRNQYHGRQNYNRSYRGRNSQRNNDNRNNNWRSNSNRPRRQNVFYTENSTAPPSGAPRAREIVQLGQAEEN